MMVSQQILRVLVIFLPALLCVWSQRAPAGELDGHCVIRIQHEDLATILELQQLDLDIWSISLEGNEMVAHVDEDQYLLLQQMPELKITVLQKDLEKIYNAPLRRQASMASRQALSADTWCHHYHPYEDIKRWYKMLADRHSKRITFVPSIGKTHEGREIFAAHVNLTPPRPDKKKIWIQSLIHGREWISGAVVQYITDQLMKLPAVKESDDPRIASLYDLEIVIIPIVNPDGYHQTWTKNRLWRKNMAQNVLGRGVDLNRNFDCHWGEGGASAIPISDTYRGPSAASEPETKAIARYFRKQGYVAGAMDWHCYSQLILFPYGWTPKKISNYAQYLRLGQKMEKAFALNGRRYKAIQSYALYPTSGTAVDWFQAQDKEILSCAIELPPSQNDGEGGFLLSEKNIPSVGAESWNAFTVFAHSAATPTLGRHDDRLADAIPLEHSTNL